MMKINELTDEQRYEEMYARMEQRKDAERAVKLPLLQEMRGRTIELHEELTELVEYNRKESERIDIATCNQ
ncbi:hypothetical protein MKY15_21775 [Sporosarcina sp. FSL K6-1540]|uniref:hypothetical protein n=1 Tax=Sporosarcina sp. FSL K6-1540 TaxID=2921555 RepID=UPI00315A31B3